jgi:integrase
MRRVNGKLVRAKIDTFDKITVEKARKQAEGILADMGRGLDPNVKKRQDRQKAEEEKRQRITLQQALDEYLQKGKLKPRTITTYRDLFRLYLADWLERSATEITRDMVRERHREIATGKRGRKVFKKQADTANGALNKAEAPKRREAAADNCFRTLRAVLNYAFEDEEGGTLYANPVNVLSSKKRKAWFKVERRRTLIKNSDLPAWSKAVESLDNPIARDYLLFLIHTGLRRNEAARLRWDQVDFEESCFTIPTTKNGEPHTLPLSDYLSSLLRKRKAEAWHENPFVFPGHGKGGYLREPKRAIDTVTANTGIVFTCHDLRRTFATIAESLDLSGYTVKALLNHKQQVGDVTGGYIILNVDRLREPMQKITNAIQERIKKQHGQILSMQAMTDK